MGIRRDDDASILLAEDLAEIHGVDPDDMSAVLASMIEKEASPHDECLVLFTKFNLCSGGVGFFCYDENTGRVALGGHVNARGHLVGYTLYDKEDLGWGDVILEPIGVHDPRLPDNDGLTPIILVPPEFRS